MNLVAYVRVSTDRQAEEGFGLEVQRSSIEKWAKKAGHDVVAHHSDEGLSGSLNVDDRPGLAAALASIRDGGAAGLVLYKLDRLARSLTVQEAVLGSVWAAGASVFTTDLGEVPHDDPDDPMRTAMRQMVGVFSQLERAMIAARMRAGRRVKAAAGGYAYGAPPYGWRAEGGELVVDEAEQLVVARMAELHAGGASLREIAEVLDRDGVRPRRGERWQSKVVGRIVRRLTAGSDSPAPAGG